MSAVVKAENDSSAGTSEPAKFALTVDPADLAENAEDMPVALRMEKQGVPKADVLEDVEAYLKEKAVSLEEAQKGLEDRYRKYKTVEMSMNERRTRLVGNLPDFHRALEYIKLSREAKAKGKTEFEVLCKVEENSFKRFRVTNLDTVVLFLGCHTYADFSLDEAEKLLSDNVDGIERVLAMLRGEIDWIRDQITTSEVSIAHLYNYGLKNKKLPEKSA